MSLFSSRPLAPDVGLLILRLVSGGSMLFAHGLPKLKDFGELSDKFADPIGIGPLISLVLVVFAEFTCAGMVALGLWVRAATIPLIITMSVAVFIAKGAGPYADQEMGVLYLCMFGTLLFTGGGRYSADRVSFN